MIHKFEQNGFRIVLDTNSGAVHLLDELSYELIDAFEKAPGKLPPESVSVPGRSAGEITECWSELYELWMRGELLTPDDERLKNYRSSEAPIKSMCLLIAHDCNLKCSYCFADGGKYGGERCRISQDTADRAIDFLIERSAGRHNLEVDFFGGEPLLNFDVVKGTVAYARSLEKKFDKNFRFTVTTNGVLLDDDKIDFINREMSNVVLSLDGRKKVNDEMRRHLGGQGSYDEIVPKFRKLVERRGGKDYYVRGTFTKHNLDFCEDVLHIYSLGFEQLSVEPVVAPATAEYAITEADLPGIFEEYDTLARRMIEYRKSGRYFNFFHFMIDLDAGPCAIKRTHGCGCGNEYVAVAANGDIFPCHQFVGIEKMKMGNVNEGTLDEDMKKEFSKADIFSKEGCSDCWAKFFCSGGCNANNYLYRGSILKPIGLSCEMEKKRVECAIMLKAALAED